MITAWISAMIATPMFALGVFMLIGIKEFEEKRQGEISLKVKLDACVFFWGGAVFYTFSIIIAIVAAIRG